MSERIIRRSEVTSGPKPEYVGPYSDVIVLVDGRDGGLRVARDCGLRKGDKVVFSGGRVNSSVCMGCPLRKGYGGDDECGFPCGAWDGELPTEIVKKGLIGKLKDLV